MKGRLESILFPKPGADDQENKYIIGRFWCKEKLQAFTAMGNIYQLEIGLNYVFHGCKWEDNHYRGTTTKQLKFSYASVEMPRNKAGIKIYLQKNFDGIGNVKAGEIVEALGENSIDILRDDPEAAAGQIKFLTFEKAKEISDFIKDQGEIERLIIELESIFADVPGLPKNTALKAIALFGNGAPDIIRENPYRLIDIPGVGFLLADTVAMRSIGIDHESDFRKEAAIYHIIKEKQQNTGSIYIDYNCLVFAVKSLIVVDVSACLDDLIAVGDIVKDRGHVALKRDCDNEWLIADKIKNKL